jgi:hypothetical protein
LRQRNGRIHRRVGAGRAAVLGIPGGMRAKQVETQPVSTVQQRHGYHAVDPWRTTKSSVGDSSAYGAHILLVNERLAQCSADGIGRARLGFRIRRE